MSFLVPSPGHGTGHHKSYLLILGEYVVSAAQMVTFCAVAELMDRVDVASDICNHVRQNEPKQHQPEERPGNMAYPYGARISESVKQQTCKRKESLVRKRS